MKKTLFDGINLIPPAMAAWVRCVCSGILQHNLSKSQDEQWSFGNAAELWLNLVMGGVVVGLL